MLLADITERLMIEVIDPLGNALTQLPVDPAHAGLTAGPGFRLSRSARIPTHAHAAWLMFYERMMELHSYCRFLEAVAQAPPVLGRVRSALAKYAEMLKAAG